MALTGNTVQSTYLDLVQLEQSGAGLPSHAGKEAALYDGSGAQIIGRTAVQNWLDPHPDAAASNDTWEFSTTGDMTQGQLETAGWAFRNCTGEVSNGVLWLTRSGSTSDVWCASLGTSLSGDFDLIATIIPNSDYFNSNYEAITYGGFGVADSGVGDTAQMVFLQMVSGAPRYNKRTAGTWSAFGGSGVTATIHGQGYLTMRILRSSGTVRLTGGSPGATARIRQLDSSPDDAGWVPATTATDSSTYDKIFFPFNYNADTTPDKFGVLSLRRFL